MLTRIRRREFGQRSNHSHWKCCTREAKNAARNALDPLKKAMSKEAERAVHCLKKDLESLLCHARFERPSWWRI
jgi:hypothetical protein